MLELMLGERSGLPPCDLRWCELFSSCGEAISRISSPFAWTYSVMPWSRKNSTAESHYSAAPAGYGSVSPISATSEPPL